jgi:hypothetical protein
MKWREIRSGRMTQVGRLSGYGVKLSIRDVTPFAPVGHQT